MQVRTFRSFLRKNECEQQFDAAFYSQCGANYLDEPEGRTPER